MTCLDLWLRETNECRPRQTDNSSILEHEQIHTSQSCVTRQTRSGGMHKEDTRNIYEQPHTKGGIMRPQLEQLQSMTNIGVATLLPFSYNLPDFEDWPIPLPYCVSCEHPKPLTFHPEREACNRTRTFSGKHPRYFVPIFP